MSAAGAGLAAAHDDAASLLPLNEADLAGAAPTLTSTSARPLGWRRRALVALALLGCVGLFALLRVLAAAPSVDAQWRSDAHGGLELAASDDARLQPLIGRTLLGVMAADGRLLPPQVLQSRISPRWLLNDAERQRHLDDRAALANELRQGSVRLKLADAAAVDVRTVPRGYAGLGPVFWLVAALALVFYLIGGVVALVRPDERNTVYALAALAQTVHLLLIGLDTLPAFGLPARWAALDLWLRIACDAVASAATVHAACIHPRRLPLQAPIVLTVWALALGFIVTTGFNAVPGLWWWTQGMQLGCYVAAYGLLFWSYRLEPHPMAMVMRRLTLAVLVALLLLTVTVALSGAQPDVQRLAAGPGALIWYVFQASALMLLPFLSRSHPVMREFTLLAGISAVATSLDLLFAAVFALGQFASHALALFLALGLYAGARQWMLNQLMGSSVQTTERMFESLYRIARDIETAEGDGTEPFARLLRELFEPLELTHTPHTATGARVIDDGAALLVPLPSVPGTPQEHQPQGSLLLRFARRGRRLFTHDDARLTNRVLEQLLRAVAFDRAVEQGRNEERARIAQDLHDDIGARLLTLMYKAPSPEMEDYLRHTLQDLKTLTRGLAATSHLLSHAGAEWKADISQRLQAAHCELAWSLSFDRDVQLTVVQWSALTRMLRELINNVIAHAQATQVQVAAQLEQGRFTLVVSDDGCGRHPEVWAHGLGLGGIRKRVKLLGGEVRWRENGSRGIVCEIRVPELVS